MHHVRLDSDLRVVSLLIEDLWPAMPPDAVAITEVQYQSLLANPMQRLVAGALTAYNPPADPLTQADYGQAIQRLIDEQARTRRYNDGASCASYAASTIPTWAAEAQAFVAWRDAVWAYAYAELAKVEAGERSQPSVDEFLAELPDIAWPG